MFIRKKGRSFYVVENRRVNGKVRQKVVACLGRNDNVDDAIAECTYSVQSPSEPDTWDEYKSWEERKTRRLDRLGLSFEDFARKQYRKRSWHTIDKLRADEKVRREYFVWRDRGIDDFLKSEYEKYLEDYRNCVAKDNARLEALWKLIPESEHAAESRVKEKVEALAQQAEARAQELERLVAEMRHALSAAGTTPSARSGSDGDSSTVVTESVSAAKHSGTTPELVYPSDDVRITEGATLADVVPEMRRERDDSGTTYGGYAE